MCVGMGAGKQAQQNDKDGRPQPIRKATDVPLGDGLADAARTSILRRRRRIEEAMEAAGE